MAKRKRGRPKGTHDKLTPEVRAEILKALEDGLPLSFACDLAGVGRRTVYDAMEKEPIFRTQVNRSRAAAINGLVAMTKAQGGAWKLLKNLGKEEFKEHVEQSVRVTEVDDLPELADEDLDEVAG